MRQENKPIGLQFIAPIRKIQNSFSHGFKNQRNNDLNKNKVTGFSYG